MIFTIKIKLVWGAFAENPWEVEVEINEGTTLSELHLIIQDVVEFDNDHMFEFFIARTENSEPVIRYECDSPAPDAINLMAIFRNLDGKKLFYRFDCGDDWLFQIAKSRKKSFEALKGGKYSHVVKEEGAKPIQYPDFD